jgi:3-oxosteroid 1-dehydrogenase
VDEPWDEVTDILVVGSGAAGLVAALVAAEQGSRALVIEKTPEFGGCSATSGGGIWIPCSHLALELGQEDTPEAAFAYIRSLSAPDVPDANISAFVETAPRMLRWLTENTEVRYQSLPYPDYHADLPGGRPGYRTHLPEPIDGRRLGKASLDLRRASPAASLLGRINWTFTETYALLFRPRGWMGVLGKMLARYSLDLPHRLVSSKDRFLTLGNALVGGLRLALDQAKIPLRLNTALVDLVWHDGRVTGAVVEQGGRRRRIGAARGVILASGGFARDRALRAENFPGAVDPTLSGAPESDTGDGLRAALAIGAQPRNLGHAWSAPVFCVPGETRGRLSTIERALPGCIIVNQAGRRYMNEAASYHLAGQAMIAADRPEARTLPSWMIFDATFRHRYPVGPVLPLVPDALLPRAVRGLLRRAATLEALAVVIGLPADALTETIGTFNAGARRGEDPLFQRGAATYDRMYGDARVTPNPTLAPIETGPFYAFPIHAGDIGTCGGVATDALARALDSDGRPIEGLHVVGNCAASVMGGSYPGAGSTLGPAMTFAFLAARHLGQAAVNPDVAGLDLAPRAPPSHWRGPRADAR